MNSEKDTNRAGLPPSSSSDLLGDTPSETGEARAILIWFGELLDFLLRLNKLEAKIFVLRLKNRVLCLENRVLSFQNRHLRFRIRQTLLKNRGEWNLFQYIGDYAHNVIMPNVKVSGGSQPPLTFGLSLSESAGSRSLHRLVGPSRLRVQAGRPARSVQS